MAVNDIISHVSQDEDFRKPEDVYEFSNDRTFKSTDHSDSGVYEDADE